MKSVDFAVGWWLVGHWPDRIGRVMANIDIEIAVFASGLPPHREMHQAEEALSREGMTRDPVSGPVDIDHHPVDLPDRLIKRDT